MKLPASTGQSCTDKLSTHPKAGGLMKPRYLLPWHKTRSLSTHPKAGGLMKQSRAGEREPLRLGSPFNPPQGGRVDETSLATYTSDKERDFQPTPRREG